MYINPPKKVFILVCTLKPYCDHCRSPTLRAPCYWLKTVFCSDPPDKSFDLPAATPSQADSTGNFFSYCMYERRQQLQSPEKTSWLTPFLILAFYTCGIFRSGSKKWEHSIPSNKGTAEEQESGFGRFQREKTTSTAFQATASWCKVHSYN